MDKIIPDSVVPDRAQRAVLAAVLDQTHDCIKLLDLDGTIRHVNRQGALLMELSSPAALIGQSYVDRWPQEARSLAKRALAEAAKGSPARFTASRPRANGKPSWWDVTVSPVHDSDDTITHLITIARDMTVEVEERQRVEAISLEMRHRLKNALTVASGIVMMQARGRPEIRKFASDVVTRFGQLAAVQASVLDPEADRTIPRIVALLTEAYGDAARLEFGELPDVRLGHQAMQALALCFGELATNSLKYGALRDGRPVRIAGRLADDLVELEWTEETMFGTARPGGQGLGLMERLIGTAGGSFMRQVTDGCMTAFFRLPIEP